MCIIGLGVCSLFKNCLFLAGYADSQESFQDHVYIMGLGGLQASPKRGRGPGRGCRAM